MKKEEGETVILRYLLAWVTLLAESPKAEFYDEIPDSYLTDTKPNSEQHGYIYHDATEAERLIIQKEAQKIAVKMYSRLKKINGNK